MSVSELTSEAAAVERSRGTRAESHQVRSSRRPERQVQGRGVNPRRRKPRAPVGGMKRENRVSWAGAGT